MINIHDLYQIITGYNFPLYKKELLLDLLFEEINPTKYLILNDVGPTLGLIQKNMHGLYQWQPANSTFYNEQDLLKINALLSCINDALRREQALDELVKIAYDKGEYN